MRRQLSVTVERWPLAAPFRISRGSVRWVDLVVVELSLDGARGRGECRPYPRYGETPEVVVASLEAVRPVVEDEEDRDLAVASVTTSAGRNALDCALWDLEAKLTGRRVWELAELGPPQALTTAVTLGLDSPQAMAAAAGRFGEWPLLKVKLDAEVVGERLRAVREAAPSARLIVDANEAWSAPELPRLLEACAEVRVEMVEQPLPVGADEVLAAMDRPVPVCADESVHGLDDLERCAARYDLVNIKLDKTGGLTPALALREAAWARGLGVMVGCMVATSLSIAPAHLLAQGAEVVDLDGPVLLERDRTQGLSFADGVIPPPPPALWG